jgi:antitoxin ParD1/3/4
MSDVLVLPPDLAAKVQARIDSGASADEVDALRAAFEALEASDAAKLEALRAKIARALADPRPSVPADEAFDRVSAALAAYKR